MSTLQTLAGLAAILGVAYLINEKEKEENRKVCAILFDGTWNSTDAVRWLNQAELASDNLEVSSRGMVFHQIPEEYVENCQPVDLGNGIYAITCDVVRSVLI